MKFDENPFIMYWVERRLEERNAMKRAAAIIIVFIVLVPAVSELSLTRANFTWPPTSPKVSITSPINETTYNSNNLTLDAVFNTYMSGYGPPDTKTFTYTLDGNRPQPLIVTNSFLDANPGQNIFFECSANLSDLTNGAHSLSVYGELNYSAYPYGNFPAVHTESNATVIFRIDKPVPSASIVYPTNGTVVDANMGAVNIYWQYPANSTFSWVGCSLNGAGHGYGNTTVTGKNETSYIENDGEYTFTLYANDTAGYWAIPQTVTFHVNIVGDAVPINWVAVIAVVALISAVIILFALAVLVAYRRKAPKNQQVVGQETFD
jgi:hypothetical protein